VTAAALDRAPSIGRAFTAQLQRDLTIAFRSRSELINPLMFYVMGISMFPLGVGPGAERLSEIAPGVLWVLALLSTLLSLDALFRRDFDDGTLEQLVLNVDPLFVGVLAKVLAHWLVIGLPLTLLSPLAALMLFLPGAAVPTLVLTLLLGTPILSLLGAVGAALTVGLKRGGLLLTLIILPLYVPVLILGAGAVTAVIDGVDPSAQLAWLAVILALMLTLTPFAAALALRVGLE
jgi:heme exporter protein B